MKPFASYIESYFHEIGGSNERVPDGRAASFDFCYNYFFTFYEEDKIQEIADPENIQLSCLQLGFYLASWGMLRGSSFLLQKSIKHYEALINIIAKTDHILWEIDLNTYDQEDIRTKLIATKSIIKRALGTEKSIPSDTLTTKIMLGVFGNLPAFDTYFTQGMKNAGYKFSGTFNNNSLKTLHECYVDHKKAIDSYDIRTLGFNNGKETNIRYTKAKNLDMYGVMKDDENNK